MLIVDWLVEAYSCTAVILDCMYVPLPAVALPHVAAYKHSEHGNEKDKGVMVCVSHGYPLPTDWTWFKEEDGASTVCVSQACNFYYLEIIHDMFLTHSFNPEDMILPSHLLYCGGL